MSKAGKNGVTSKTPQNIPFGAGTIHKNLKYTEGTGWNFEESLYGATSGGSKFSYVPEITTVEIDGVLVKAKQFDKKTGETAKMEINLAELSADTIKTAIVGKTTTSEDVKFTKIISKADIETGDYWENIAFVGETLKGEKIIVIMGNALCTSGFELEGKSKEPGVLAATFECSADPDEENQEFNVLPVQIYYPVAE